MREGNAMTELTALLTKALLSTTFGVNREQRYSGGRTAQCTRAGQWECVRDP